VVAGQYFRRHNINIRSSSWAPYLAGFKPNPKTNLLNPPNLHISDLINPVDRTWNIPLIHNMFDTYSAQQILNIHLPLSHTPDRWIWAPPIAQFFEKSSHEMLIQSHQTRTLSLDPADWNCLWSLKLQHRLKHLLWKIVWNSLPVRDNIGKFSHSFDQELWFCPICQGPPESLHHIFLECSFARIIWRNLKLPCDTTAFQDQSMASLIKDIFKTSWSTCQIKKGLF